MLRDRNILLVTFARFVSRLGGIAAFFIGTWGKAAYTFEATPQQLAWMMLGSSLAAIVGSIIAGVLIDRFGPRVVLIGAEILTIPAVLALAAIDDFRLFAIFVAAFSAVGVPTFTAGAAFAPYLVTGREDLEKVNSLIEGAGSLAFVLGPALGAVVSTAYGIDAVFYLMAVGSVLAVAAAWFVRIEVAPRAHDAGHPVTEFVEGLRLSYATRSLRYFILTGTLVWFGFGAFSALEPLFYRDAVQVGVEWIGWMNTAFGVGMIVGAAVLPRLPQRAISARGLAIVSVGMGLGTVMYVGSTDLRVIAVGACAWGFIIGVFEPLVRTLIHVESPHDYVGRVVGTAQYHKNAGELVPLAIAPALAAQFGVQAVLIAGGLVVAVIAALTFPIAVAIDRTACEVRPGDEAVCEPA